MRRIDTMSKEEIAKLLDKQNRFDACKDCPAASYCNESCPKVIADYLLDEIEVEMVPRASFLTIDESVEEFLRVRGKTKMRMRDLADYVRFLKEKVPRPANKQLIIGCVKEREKR